MTPKKKELISPCPKCGSNNLMTVIYRCGTGLDCLDCQHSQFVWDKEEDDDLQNKSD